uniref:Succinate dehydrogenase subunit 4 n=1 Tax=Ophirina amphinema TaxID=2108040 RepID=A0A348AYS7_9EUKA|nr:succinate dehydrogenase subunit 4 [Ophirina amphinema]
MINKLSYALSRKSGHIHWLLQRLTSIILVLLISSWLFSFIFDLGHGSSLLFYSFLITMLHLYLGFYEVIKDYIHNPNTYSFCIGLYNIFFISSLQYLILAYVEYNAIS